MRSKFLGVTVGAALMYVLIAGPQRHKARRSSSTGSA